MNEFEYKEYIYQRAKNVKTKEELDSLLKDVIKSKDLDYGKIVYAICACMNATMNYIDNSPVGGITGFQASFIGWEMVKEYMSISKDSPGLKLIDYENMLYPQYEEKFEKKISLKLWSKLQEQARKLLIECPNAHPNVIKHWKSIARGHVPFGYEIENYEIFNGKKIPMYPIRNKNYPRDSKGRFVKRS